MATLWNTIRNNIRPGKPFYRGMVENDGCQFWQRQAYSQAYHHQANGGAEMAGQQIIERLRKIQIQEKINWVESLLAVIYRIHDIPGVTGLSPYQILFGWDRPLANIPYQNPRECEDAQQFF